jgi:nicotinamidase/pyrazinamidase
MDKKTVTNSDALLIVDVQRDFLPGGALAVPDGKAVVPALNDLAKQFAERGLPVIASRDWHPPDHCSFEAAGGPWPPHCVAGTPGAEFDASLELPEGTRIVDKATTAGAEAYSAFQGTDLDAWLAERGVKRLFVGGVATDYCVLESAMDARRHGYEVIVLTDAIRAIDLDDGAKALEALEAKGAELADSGTVLRAAA